MEYEKCYVFEPEEARPTKRQKTERYGLHASWSTRQEAYEKAWQAQKQRIDNVLDTVNGTTLTSITDFLDEQVQISHSPRIPTGIILAGPGAASQNSLAGRIESAIRSHKKRVYVPLDSNSTSNLKAALKTLIQRATSTSTADDEDDDDLATTSRKGPRLLNYDLQNLHDYVVDRGIEQVVITFHDTEALPGELLSGLIELMGNWCDRVPFVCLFHVATSVEFLQSRLSRAAVQTLDGRMFDAAPSTTEVQLVFSAIVDPDAHLWIGPTLLTSALERQNDYIQTVDDLVDMVQYAYMSSYYANALSIFLDPTIKMEDIPSDHFEGLRNLDSFRDMAQALLANRENDQVRLLLDSDEALFTTVRDGIATGKELLHDITTALDVIRTIQGHLPGNAVSLKSSLYIQAMSSKLHGSTLLRSLLLSVRKAPSDVVRSLFDALQVLGLHASTLSQSSTLQSELASLTTTATKTQPLRSEDDIGSSTMRTTVVAQKVHLSKQKSQLSEQDAAYTAIVRKFTDLLETYFERTLIDPKTLPFNEIFLYDLKSPHREVFTPRPRHAIERALAAPHDYLACECCAPNTGEGDEATLSATQPATAVLYQLYLESGSLVNVSDLWQAFQAVMGEMTAGEEGLMALFQRALAELRYLGFVKSTRKRADHVAKVAWRAL